MNLPDTPTIIPPYLKPGDTVGITCPAGYFSLDDIQPAVEALHLWGYRTIVGATVGTREGTYSGTDAARAEDLQHMLDSAEVKAVLFGRGGYGTIRIIDRLDFNAFYLRPKWLCGYSDLTVLHSFVQTQLHIPTLHSEMCIDLQYGTQDASALTLQRALRGDELSYRADPQPLNRQGTASGVLVGGNLTLLTAMVGSSSDLDTGGRILFIEDVHVYLYQLDEMMWTLRRAGRLAFLSGLVVGGMTKIRYDPGDPPFGATAYEIIASHVRDYDYPVCHGFPAGHEFNNYAVRLGMVHRLTVTGSQSFLEEV
jgi:muramoyltetrapeptide carboxypeptidase